MSEWFTTAYEGGYLFVIVLMSITSFSIGAWVANRLSRGLARDAIWANQTLTPREKARMLAHVYGKPPDAFIAQLEWDDRQRREFMERHRGK